MSKKLYKFYPKKRWNKYAERLKICKSGKEPDSTNKTFFKGAGGNFSGKFVANLWDQLR